MSFNLDEYLRQELSIKGLEDLQIDGRPLWRLVRSEFRDFYMGGGQITISKWQVETRDLKACSFGELTGFVLCTNKNCIVVVKGEYTFPSFSHGQ